MESGLKKDLQEKPNERIPYYNDITNQTIQSLFHFANICALNQLSVRFVTLQGLSNQRLLKFN